MSERIPWRHRQGSDPSEIPPGGPTGRRDGRVVTTERDPSVRHSIPRRTLANAIGIDALYVVAWMVIVSLVLSLMIFVPPFGEILGLFLWPIYGDSHLGGGWTGLYHFVQLSTVLATIFVFARTKGSKGLHYLDRSHETPLGSKFKRIYRLLLPLVIVLVFFLVTELAFCSIPETCLTHNYVRRY